MEGLVVQGRVVQALMLREVKTRFGKERLGYLWAVIEPSLYVLVFVALLSYRQRPIPGGMNIVLFMITGITPFMLFQGTVTRSLNAVYSNQQLLYFPQVKIIDFFVSRVLLEFITWIVVFALLIFVTSAFGVEVQIHDPLGVVACIALAAFLGFSFGLTLGVLVPLWPTLERLVPYVFIKPLFFTSGLFFTADMVPPDLRELLLLNALLHLSELLRTAFFAGFESRHGDWNYVIMQSVVMAAIGLTMLRAAHNKLLAAVHDQ